MIHYLITFQQFRIALVSLCVCVIQVENENYSNENRDVPAQEKTGLILQPETVPNVVKPVIKSCQIYCYFITAKYAIKFIFEFHLYLVVWMSTNFHNSVVSDLK